MSETGKRLKTLIKQAGFTNKKFAELTDVAPNYISILIRRGDISDKFKYSIKKVIPESNINWLETGKGEMFTSPTLSSDYFSDLSGVNKIPIKEFALIAAQNIERLKKEPVFYNTFVMEALNLIKEVQNEDGSIDVLKIQTRS